MKKLILSVVASVGFSFSSTAQCGEQATQLNCGGNSYCVSIQVPFTGILHLDIANLNATGGTMMRKPTMRELLLVSDEICD